MARAVEPPTRPDPPTTSTLLPAGMDRDDMRGVRTGMETTVTPPSNIKHIALKGISITNTKKRRTEQDKTDEDSQEEEDEEEDEDRGVEVDRGPRSAWRPECLAGSFQGAIGNPKLDDDLRLLRAFSRQAGTYFSRS
eukprot:scaffold1378_cov257-Pinguiococcus_pyrenoidosus.AAC.3